MLYALSTHWSKLLDAKWCMPLMIVDAWMLGYDTPFIEGWGVGRMMVFQCGTKWVLVGLEIVIICGTWRVLNILISLLSMQIRHLRWRYLELKALIRVVGLVASFPTTPISSHLDFYSSRYDLIFTPKTHFVIFPDSISLLTSKPFLA